MSHLKRELNSVKMRNVLASIPAVNYMFKINNRSTRTRFEVCSKLTIKTPERRQ